VFIRFGLVLIGLSDIWAKDWTWSWYARDGDHWLRIDDSLIDSCQYLVESSLKEFYRFGWSRWVDKNSKS
jgi:hypothetical protein